MNTIKKQVKIYGPRPISGWGTGALIKASVRFDDMCNNGYNSFAITGEVYIPGRRDCEACGCLHEDIAKAFPELAPFIKYHLMDSEGPMHYIANVTFLAGDRDCWGKRKGEPKSYETVILFADNPIKHRFSRKFIQFLKEAKPHNERGAYDFEVLPVENERKAGYPFKPKYTFGGFDAKWYECPFDTEGEACDFLTALQRCKPEFATTAVAWGEGKARELDAARAAAVWPDATDEELTAPGLEDRLKARLPKLLAEFRAAVESLGLKWEQSETVGA